MVLPTVDQIAEAIGWPAAEWVGHCDEVAHAVVAAGIIDGSERYGLYRGPVASGTYFANRGPLVQHGWIELVDASVVDPSRWVFEGVDPYIYHGPNNGDYDFGANTFRAENQPPPPAPAEGERVVKPVFPPVTQAWVNRTMGPALLYQQYTIDQVFWLANLSLQTLGVHAAPVYRAIIEADEEGAIPLDNRRHVLGR